MRYNNLKNQILLPHAFSGLYHLSESHFIWDTNNYIDVLLGKKAVCYYF